MENLAEMLLLGLALPLHDPVSLPGVYEIKLQAKNPTGDGTLSVEQTVTVPGRWGGARWQHRAASL